MSAPGSRRLEYERVADELRSMIVTGELRPGDRLPPEGELTERMAVSRSTLREALRVLSTQKLLTSSRGVGGGTFVAEPSTDDVADYLQTSIGMLSRNRLSVGQLLQVRTMIEVPGAGLAARHRSEADLDRLAATVVVAGDAAGGKEVDWSANSRFHVLLLRATENPLLEVVARPIFTVMRDRFLRDRAGAEFWRRVAVEHAEILGHVRDRNAAAASRAMRNHLTALRDTYTRIDVSDLGGTADGTGGDR
ncbi:FadR/GntR family transcriptional regulator [Pseudonocardia benzenivorans]|uniref:GntR domain protein n=2 Tax=Pseudonocardia TaxID=1847 RepID=F4CNR2_PSEUX|nr:FadR/GntR family transcriptional regulator [Pseudonocardia dioxanivorans]AEA22375.1 GntR domain protein [Pseudonocardia dioxanivorans CB1190]GJF02161.1 GntR family transcriptional regulator [Pseudonocardia sp. D17]